MVHRLSKLPEAIIFDWDNTLVDTWPTIHACLEVTFREMGHEPWSLEDVVRGRGGIHRSLRESFPEIFGDDWEKAKQIYHGTFAEVHLEQLTPIEGAEEMLSEISRHNILLAVVSNKTGKYLRQEITHLGWDHYFHSVVGALDAEKDKPDPAPVYLALEGTGIEASEAVWFMGDSETDIKCAHNASCKPLFFSGNSVDKALQGWMDKIYHVASYRNLARHVETLSV